MILPLKPKLTAGETTSVKQLPAVAAWQVFKFPPLTCCAVMLWVLVCAWVAVLLCELQQSFPEVTDT